MMGMASASMDRSRRGGMEEYEVEIPGQSAWTVSLALVEEFTRSWRAEVQEYDITQTGGTITLAVPNDREFRIARTKAGVTIVRRTLHRSRDVLQQSVDHALAVR